MCPGIHSNPTQECEEIGQHCYSKIPGWPGLLIRALSGRVKWHHSEFGFHDLWLSADMLYSWVMEEKGLVNTHTHTLACRGHDGPKPLARMWNKSVNRRCSISKLKCFMSLYSFSSVCTASALTTKYHSAPRTCLTKILLSCLYAGRLTWRVLFVCFMTSEWTLSRVGLLPGGRRVAHLAFLYLSWLGNWVCAEINRYFLSLAQQGVWSFHSPGSKSPGHPVCGYVCMHIPVHLCMNKPLGNHRHWRGSWKVLSNKSGCQVACTPHLSLLCPIPPYAHPTAHTTLNPAPGLSQWAYPSWEVCADEKRKKVQWGGGRGGQMWG